MAAGVLQRAALQGSGAAAGGGGGGNGGAGQHGPRPVELLIDVITQGKRVRLRPSRLRVVPDPAVLRRLGEVLGPEHVHVVGSGST
jgi:hypothetical protein